MRQKKTVVHFIHVKPFFMKKPKETKWLVQSGKDVVELRDSGLTKEQADTLVAKLKTEGHKHVRARKEDPYHPSWPLEFDAEKQERLQLAKEKRQQQNEDSQD